MKPGSKQRIWVTRIVDSWPRLSFHHLELIFSLIFRVRFGHSAKQGNLSPAWWTICLFQYFSSEWQITLFWLFGTPACSFIILIWQSNLFFYFHYSSKFWLKTGGLIPLLFHSSSCPSWVHAKQGRLPGSVEEYHLKILAIRPPTYRLNWGIWLGSPSFLRFAAPAPLLLQYLNIVAKTFPSLTK